MKHVRLIITFETVEEEERAGVFLGVVRERGVIPHEYDACLEYDVRLTLSDGAQLRCQKKRTKVPITEQA